MRVLTVCREIPSNSALHNYSIAEFIYEQNQALATLGVLFDYYLIKSGGLKNYIKEMHKFDSYLIEKEYIYDIIHAHGGHIGSLVNTQRKIPVVTTYHGSDINNPKNRLVSLTSLLFSKVNIFVSPEIFYKVKRIAREIIIPCGVDFNNFMPLEKLECRKKLGFKESEKIILFAGRQERKEKNYNLAREAAMIANIDTLIELKDYSREEVNQLLNACDLLLLTSISEGSPQVIKEAMACNCPIITTDVGDIRKVIDETDGCYITSFEPEDIAEKIKLALEFNRRTNGREKISHFDNKLIAKRVYKLYQQIVKD